MHRRVSFAAMATAVLLLLVACAQAQSRGQSQGREKIIGLPCEGCEAVFEGLPDAMASRSRIAPHDEPGQAMRIDGTVFDRNGQPAPGVIVYAYHTDAQGIYPADERLRGKSAFRHGRLRGWAKTDGQGRYRFDTIRPASYPDSEVPAHVHMHVIEPGCCTYYIESIEFLDDPRLSPQARNQAGARGGTGLLMPAKDESGVWVAVRDIHLGKGVSGYPQATSDRGMAQLTQARAAVRQGR